jgi:hypothetical protein
MVLDRHKAVVESGEIRRVRNMFSIKGSLRLSFAETPQK